MSNLLNLMGQLKTWKIRRFGDDANAISSNWRGMPNRHAVLLDLDVPAYLVPSTTPGHGHLYIDASVDEKDYSKLLDALADCGVIERNYAEAPETSGRHVPASPVGQERGMTMTDNTEDSDNSREAFLAGTGRLLEFLTTLEVQNRDLAKDNALLKAERDQLRDIVMTEERARGACPQGREDHFYCDCAHPDDVKMQELLDTFRRETYSLRDTVDKLTDEKLRLQAEVDRLRELKPVDELLKAQDGWKSADRSRLEAQTYALKMRKELAHVTDERDRLQDIFDRVRSLAAEWVHPETTDKESPNE